MNYNFVLVVTDRFTGGSVINMDYQELVKENENLKEQMEKLRQYAVNTFEEMIVKEENMKEVDDLKDEVRNLDKSVKSLWRHQLILAGVLCFTEICDLIVSLFQK